MLKMLNMNFKRLLLLIASLLILIGIGLMLWSRCYREVKVIKIDLADIEPIRFEELCLLPGEQCEYDLKFKKNTVETKYDLNLRFIELETEEEHRLKEFAHIRVESDGEVLFDELMLDAFEGETLSLTVDFREDKNTELKIIYYMPIDVGNEAQNAEAFFELLITASNE